MSGHHITLVSKDIIRASNICKSSCINIIPAPKQSIPKKSFPLSINYSQNLLRNGYWHLPSLQQHLKDWLAIFEAYHPDLVLAEHAPTALLSAKIMDLPRAVTGTGFSLPPQRIPMPGLQPWFSIPDRHLLKTEVEFLEILNPVIRSLGGQELKAVKDIFDQAELFLCTFPELDHYAGRETIEYLGPILYTSNQQSPKWPAFDGTPVFLYMHAANRMLRPLLTLLKSMPVSVLACISAMPKDEIQRWTGKNLRIVSHPVNLLEVVKHCQLMISQGGMNTGAFMLLHGIPLFLIPLELEQMLWAYRLSQQGLAAAVNFFSSQPKIETNLMNILETDTILNNVRKFSKSHSKYDSFETVQRIVKRCSLLMDS